MPTEARAPQRRGHAVLLVVLETTLELIGQQGYAFSVDEVASAAGVHKTTIYRRWATKATLVSAAVQRLAETTVAVHRTGDPIADLTALAVSVARTLRTPLGTQALRAVVAAAGEDPEALASARAFLSGRYHLAAELVDEAVEGGHLAPVDDAVLLWEAMVNPLHVRALMGTPASDATAEMLVALVLAGARPRVAAGC